MFISDKKYFKTKTVMRSVEGHSMMIRGLIQKEGVTIVNVYVP